MTKHRGETSGTGNGLRSSWMENARILVVEDSATQAESLRYTLEKEGYEVFVAGNGREALKRLGEIKPAVVVSDIVMPEMDGLRLCREMKSDENLKDIPLILLTALSDPKDVLKGLECGADNFITKPYDQDYLLSKVRYVLTNTGVGKENGKPARIEILFQGEKYFIASERRQMLDLLLSSYETAVTKNQALGQSEARFRLLSGTAERLLGSSDPQEIVNELCREVMEHLDCHVFFNFLVDEETGRLHLNACAGIPEEEIRRIEWLDFGVAVCGCVARDAVRIVAQDIFNTPDPRTDLVRSYGIRAYACHPLMVGERSIGTLSFGTRTRAYFSEEDLSLMKTVTDQVATAMERMRLVKELERSRDELESRVEARTAELQKSNEALSLYTTMLERSNRDLEDFAYVASHDLQEPTRKIQTIADRLAMLSGSHLSDQAADYLKRLQGAAGRAQALVLDLLRYSRVTSNLQPITRFNLREPVEEAVADLWMLCEEAEGRIEIDTLPEVEADKVQMRQLFQNLIGNSLKYRSERKPLVRIRGVSADSEGFHEIRVEDNGIGFDDRYLDRIFKPFQRLHGKKSPYPGTGMGLAICRRIVERHGGTITATSKEGEGSAFIVRLPGKQQKLEP